VLVSFIAKHTEKNCAAAMRQAIDVLADCFLRR
jgi:hypothetical protein